MLGSYASETSVTAVGLDTSAIPEQVGAILPKDMPVQGHLDPLLLLAGGGRLVARTQELVAAYADRPHIFNLGHGITPDADPENVQLMIDTVRSTS